MQISDFLDLDPDVTSAIQKGAPVVALESTIISHGLPWPINLELAQELEQRIRDGGAVPATIGISKGRIKVGMSDHEISAFAESAQRNDGSVEKISRRDLATAVALGKDGSTTVAATMICAQMAGIRVFATGGIGGVHRGAEISMDISADLLELAQTRVCVVCAGPKAILDIPRTMEVLETHGVPVLGYQTTALPTFYSPACDLNVDQQLNDATQAARILKTRDALDLAGGELIVNPIPKGDAIAAEEIDAWIEDALKAAEAKGIQGKATTPYLLDQMARLSEGRTIQANLGLVRNNVRVAIEIATQYCNG